MQGRARLAVGTTLLLTAALAGCAGATGRVFRDCPTCPEMVTIPAGRFLMGSPSTEAERDPDESPQREVVLDNAFAVSRHEVTRAEFAVFVASSGYAPITSCRVWAGTQWEEQTRRSWRDPLFQQNDDHPVVCISWHDARAYASWLAKQTGAPYRLLSEAEWEYAARAGSTSMYFFGNDPDQLCTTDNGHDRTSERVHQGMSWPGVQCDDGFAETAPVGSFQANPFGLHDVHGNVWEWLQDCYADSYAKAPANGAAVEAHGCRQRVYRGGGWSVEKRGRRAANRGRFDPSAGYGQLGLRVARDLP